MKTDEQLGWMYKEDKPDLDEYLLGRKIDKHIENDEEKQEQNKGILEYSTDFFIVEEHSFSP